MAVMTRFVSMRHQIDKPQPFRQDHISISTFLGNFALILTPGRQKAKMSKYTITTHQTTAVLQLEHHKPHKLMHTNLIYQCILI
jgi:hypothetical protein